MSYEEKTAAATAAVTRSHLPKAGCITYATGPTGCGIDVKPVQVRDNSEPYNTPHTEYHSYESLVAEVNRLTKQLAEKEETTS